MCGLDPCAAQAAKKELSEALTASGTTLSQQLDAKVQELTAQQEAVTAQAESRFKVWNFWQPMLHPCFSGQQSPLRSIVVTWGVLSF